MPLTRRVPLILLLALMVGGRSFPALALTAKEMQNHCHELTAKARTAGGDQLDIPNSPGALVCYGFFSAVQRFTVFQKEGEQRQIFGICAPPQTTLLQLIELFQKYVQGEPSRSGPGCRGRRLDGLPKKISLRPGRIAPGS